jgi:hypothetical protein
VNGSDTDQITAYVEGVRAALSGLPDATRDELLEDLPEHLAEVAADDVGTLTDRLGPPSVYAAELLASAGYVGGFPDPPASRTDHLAEIRETTLRRLRIVDVKAGPVFGYERASDFLILLRPAWWVLRGYLAAMVLAWTLDGGAQPIGLLPRIGGSEVVALVLLGGSVWASIWLGRRSLQLAKGPKYALWAGSAVLVLVAMAGFLNADSSTRSTYYTDVNYDDPYGHVRDVFVYDEQGRLIDGARLFDQDGQPLRLGDPYCGYAYTEEAEAIERSTYPYCPENAPFRMPGAEDAVPAAPSRSAPSGSAPTDPAAPESPPSEPTPTDRAPSASVRPAPSPSR